MSICTVCSPSKVLQKLFERLTNKDLKLSDIRQAELEQKKKLNKVLEEVNDYLQLDIAGGTTKWSVDSIHSKNYVAILHLLVALAIKSHADIRNGFLVLLLLLSHHFVIFSFRVTLRTAQWVDMEA